MAKKEEAALAPITERFMALTGSGVAALAVIRENLGTESLNVRDLEQIRVPTGGGKFFTVGEEAVAALRGVILSSQAQRAYWSVPFDETGGGAPPDCYSEDQITGRGNPGGDCFKCPLAQFGSAPKGDGQACRAFRTVFLLAPDSPLPYVLMVPPTSLANFRAYIVKELGKANQRSIAVETEFTLETDKSKGGITYSKIKPRYARSLNVNELEAVSKYAEAIMPYLAQARRELVQESQGI